MSEFLAVLVDYAWGMPLIILLMGGGAYLAVRSKFVPLKAFAYSVRLIRGKIHHEGEENAEGQLSHFKALTNALSATIGVGNIAGVAVAITQGGPGAIFWMWVSAFIGMNTKFFECTLAVMYRGKDYTGEVQGGPMYVIEKALPKLKPLAYMFAFCGLIGTLSLFQVNQFAALGNEYYGVDPLYVGIFSALFVGYIAFGGVKRLAQITSSVVPFMCVFYVLMSLIVIFMNAGKVPEVFGLIFSEAFSGKAVGGGVFAGILIVLKIGVKRAAFSNEAGMGTASMAHSNAKTNEPISEGLVAMMGPFIDTLVVCTMTALVILLTLDPASYGDNTGVVITTQAFVSQFGEFGKHFLGVSVLLFSLTTMLGMSNYNEKCWNFIFKGKKFFRRETFLVVYCLTIVVGAVTSADDVINFLDSGFAFMAIPNMIATIILAPKVIAELNKYAKKYMS